MSKKIIAILIMIFAIFGIILAGSLTIAKYNEKVALLCGENKNNDCNLVQNSEYSYLINVKNDDGTTKFQVPLSLAGVLFYTILLISGLMLYLKDKKGEDSPELRYFLFIIGFIGIIFSVSYTWIQAYKIEAFCTYCLISAFDSIVIFILITIVAFGIKIDKGKKLDKKINKKKVKEVKTNSKKKKNAN